MKMGDGRKDNNAGPLLKIWLSLMRRKMIISGHSENWLKLDDWAMKRVF